MGRLKLKNKKKKKGRKMRRKFLTFILAGMIGLFLVGFSQVAIASFWDLFGDLAEKISATYTYVSGILVSALNENNEITVYDRGMPRATEDENGNILRFWIYGTDDVIDDDDVTEKEKMESFRAFLAKYGLSEEDLQATNGDAENPEPETVEWISDALDWLEGGINHSISIDLTATGGPSVTFSENDKPQEEYARDGELITEWHYNTDGTLDYVDSLEITALTQKQYDELDDDEKEGFTQEGDLWIKKVARRTIYEGGKADKVYELDEMGGTYTEDDLVQEYYYADNGSLIKIYDKKKDETTYYSGGKAQYTLNSEESVVREWNYHENGSLDTVTSMNDQGEWTTTAYENGRALITVEGQDVSGDSMRATYDAILAGTYDLDENSAGVISINLYIDQLAGLSETELTELLESVLDETATEVEELVKFLQDEDAKVLSANGASLALTIRYSNTETADTEDGDATYLSEALVTAYHYGQQLVTFRYNHPDPTLPAAAVQSVIPEVIDVDYAEDLVGYELTEDNWEDFIDDLKGKIDDLSEDELNSLFKADISSSFSRSGYDYSYYGAYMSATRDHFKDVLDGLKDLVSNVIKGEVEIGSDEYKEALDPLIEDWVKTYEPTIIGTISDVMVEVDDEFYSYEEALNLGIDLTEATYYVVVDADQIDIYDGEGFQDAEGETFYVEIDASLVAEMQDNIGEKVLFAGDVAQDADGYLSITMNEAYGGGYAIGEEAIDAYLDAREGSEWYQDLIDVMTSLWDDITQEYGEHSDWRQGFEFLKRWIFGM